MYKCTSLDISMNSTPDVQGLVIDVMQNIGPSLPRTLRLANGLEYMTVVPEAAWHSTDFFDMFDNELLVSFRMCFLPVTLVVIGMNSSEGIEGLVTNVMQDVGPFIPRTLRLANGL